MIKIELPYSNLSEIEKRNLSVSYYKLAEITNEKWLSPIYKFLGNWFNETDFIELKTSGSTGEPKLIHVKKSAMIFSAQQTINYFDLKKNDNILLCLPSEFIGGMMMIVRAILGELSLFAIEPKMKLDLDLNLKFVFSAMIPSQVEDYLSQELNTIEKIIIGGAAVPLNLEKAIQRNNSTQFWSTYGMTETVSHIALRKLNGESRSDYFTAFKNILIGKDDRDCLTIYNRNYSENVIITNDIVEFDFMNDFKIIGRFDNVINSGGLKIIPEEIENSVGQLISARVIVFGLPDEKLGQKVILLVEDKPWDTITLNLFQNSLKEKLGNKSPKHIYFMEKFVNTANEKLDRKKTVQLSNESSH